MGLYVKGLCLTSRSRQVTSKKGEEFTFYKNCVHDPDSNSDPVYVETNQELARGQWYRIPVYVSTFKTANGDVRIQYNTYKDNPPVKIAAPAPK
ncbi:hypothetical protein C4J81_10335 [Deltaproteobacteria bacterium Smac51]|nr:hypothetical protein C4J81_10335 [Deltaproteobacteria bacterium Smac51]